MLKFLRTHQYSLSRVLLPLVLAMVLYAPTLPLPYFWDDFPNFHFAEAKSYFDVWTNVTGLPYYRPVVFTFNKLVTDIVPTGVSWVPHLFLLLVHVANSMMMGKIVGAFFSSGRQVKALIIWLVEILTAVLFVTYPFAILPVAHFASATHLFVLFLTLSGVTAVIQYHCTEKKKWLAIALVFALLAAFTHEAGIMAGAVMALAYLLYDWRVARHQWGWLLGLPLAGALFLPIWDAVPKTDNESIVIQLGNIELVLMKTSFFLQGLTYPFQPLARWLMQTQHWHDIHAIWLVGGLFLVLLALVLWRGKQVRILLFGLGWLVLTMLPSVVALPYDYISISPRLLYFTGAGGAMIWSAGVVTFIRLEKQWWVKTTVMITLLVFTFVLPIVYVRREVTLHKFALAPLSDMVELAQSFPDAQDIIINAPNWLAYKQPWYPIGNDGVAVLAPYLNSMDLVELNSGIAWHATVATFPEIRPNLEDYYLATANEDPEQLWHMEKFTQEALRHKRVWLTMYGNNGRSRVVYAGEVNPGKAQIPSNYLANYENKVYLTDSSFFVEDDTLTITLDWVYTGEDPQATIFRNAFDCAGNLVGEGSGFALERMLPFTFLDAGTTIQDVKHIPLLQTSADGCYQVEVGLFRPDGSRLKTFAEDGTELANQLYLARE